MLSSHVFFSKRGVGQHPPAHQYQILEAVGHESLYEQRGRCNMLIRYVEPRKTGRSSCTGTFVLDHIGKDYTPECWAGTRLPEEDMGLFWEYQLRLSFVLSQPTVRNRLINPHSSRHRAKTLRYICT